MEVLEKQTLGEIVTHNFKAAEVFEKYDLDFCCKGKKTLEAACVEKEINIKKIMDELNKAISIEINSTDNYSEWDLDFLADYIINKHHTYTKRAIERLDFYTHKVANAHGNRHPELLRVEEIFRKIGNDMNQHMSKEEKVLFPYIKELAMIEREGGKLKKAPFVGIKAPILMMTTEHEQAGEMLEEIRNITHNYAPPADACNTYRVTLAELNELEKNLHQHVHLENNILFPKAIKLENMLNQAN